MTSQSDDQSELCGEAGESGIRAAGNRIGHPVGPGVAAGHNRRTDRMNAEAERGDDPEVAAASPQRPEQVSVLALRSSPATVLTSSAAA